MFKLLFLILLLGAGIFGVPYLAGKQGYVLIETADNYYELSITALIIILIICLALVYLIQWCISSFFRLSYSSYTWFPRHRRGKAQRQILEGFIAFAEGNYRKAQRLLANNAMNSDAPVLSLIKAAEAAQKMGDNAEASRFLKNATGLVGENNLLVEISRIKVLVAQQKWDEAQTHLDAILKTTTNNPEILWMAVKIYRHNKAYAALEQILEQIERVGIYNIQTYAMLEQEVENGLLDEKLRENGTVGLLAWWKAQSRRRRNDPVMKIGIARRLLDNDDQENAYLLLVEVAKLPETETFFQILHQQIIRLKEIDTSKLQRILEKQLSHTQVFKAELYRSLGYLYARAGDYSKASNAFSELLKNKAKLQENDIVMAIFVFEHNKESMLSYQVRQNYLKNMLGKD